MYTWESESGAVFFESLNALRAEEESLRETSKRLAVK